MYVPCLLSLYAVAETAYLKHSYEVGYLLKFLLMYEYMIILQSWYCAANCLRSFIFVSFLLVCIGWRSFKRSTKVFETFTRALGRSSWNPSACLRSLLPEGQEITCSSGMPVVLQLYFTCETELMSYDSLHWPEIFLSFCILAFEIAEKILILDLIWCWFSGCEEAVGTGSKQPWRTPLFGEFISKVVVMVNRSAAAV